MKKIFFVVLTALLFMPFISAQAKEVNVKNDIINGTITVDKANALEGEIVTLTIIPNEGYELSSIKVVDKFDEMLVTVTNNTFVMPSYNVFISAEFKEKTTILPDEDKKSSNISAQKKDNTFIYIGTGVLIIVMITCICLFLKKRKNKM